MIKKQRRNGLTRIGSTLGAGILMAAGLAGGAAVWAAEPAATAVTNSDASVVLDDNSLWRHFAVSRCAFARTADGKLEPWDLTPLGIPAGASGIWPGIAPKPATPWHAITVDEGE